MLCASIVKVMYETYNIVVRLDNRKLKFFKKNSIVAQFKAINDRISEWAYFLNLDKLFPRYLQFSVPKKRFFVDKS